MLHDTYGLTELDVLTQRVECQKRELQNLQQQWHDLSNQIGGARHSLWKLEHELATKKEEQRGNS